MLLEWYNFAMTDILSCNNEHYSQPYWENAIIDYKRMIHV